MGSVLALVVIGLPWLGAAILWLAGDRRPRLLHTLAVGFSALTGLVALALLAFTGSSAAIRTSKRCARPWTGWRRNCASPGPEATWSCGTSPR